MDIKLSDQRDRSYTLILENQSANISKVGVPSINTLSDARAFLNSIHVPTPLFWRNVWKQINAASGSVATLNNLKIIEEIAHKLKRGEWVISADKSVAPASCNSCSASSGGALGRAPGGRGDSCATEPGEDNAIARSALSKVSEDSDTGVVRNKDETTRGCPISMVSGEVVLPLVDFTLSGPVPLEWRRFYRTGHSRDCGLGHGWTHTACEYLYLEKNQVVLFDDEGRELRFARPALYQRSKLINEGLNLDFEDRGSFVLKQVHQNDKVFTRLGEGNHFRLTQIRHCAYRPQRLHNWGDIDPEEGFCINLHYNASNQLVCILGNWGKGFKFNRNAQGRIACVELVSESQKLKKAAVKKVVVEYEYSEAGDLIVQRNAAGKGEHYQYSNHIITQRTLVTGFSYYYEWDPRDNQARCLRNWGDHGIYNYHFKWEAQINTSYATDSRGYTTAYIYNEFGEIEQERDPQGGIYRYKYNRGRKIEYTDPEGNTTKYQYDKENRFNIQRDALDTYQAVRYFLGKPIEFRDKDGAIWKHNYTLQGRLRFSTDPVGHLTHYKYHKNDLFSDVTDAEGRNTHYHWSSRGELIQITDFNGNQQQLKYNDFGQITQCNVVLKPSQVRKTEPSITHYAYTLTGQLEKVIAANGDTTHYQYNEDDQLIVCSDPQGRITCFEYDGLSQVVKCIDANGYSTSYLYDKERNLTGLINENGEQYCFEYDACERLIKAADFDGRVQTYAYDKAGQLLSHQDSNCVMAEYERDAIDQMLTRVSSGVWREIDNGDVEERSRYQYDAKGQLVETCNLHQFLNFEFDLRDSLKKEHYGDINDKKQTN